MTSRLRQAFEAAVQAYRDGDAARSVAISRQLAEAAPESPEPWRLLALGLIELADYHAAEDAARRLTALSVRDAGAHRLVAVACRRRGDFDKALAAVADAARITPKNADIAALRGDILFGAGRYDEAAAVLDEAMARGLVTVGLARAFAALCPRLNRREDGVRYIDRCLSDAKPDTLERVDLLLRKADLLDGMGAFDAAFASATEANQLKMPRPNVAEYSASLERMLSAWTSERFAAVPRAADSSELPVYIVGMPRSGTSLVEQIIASHPAVFGANERNDIRDAIRGLQPATRGLQWHLTHPEILTQAAINDWSARILTALRAAAPADVLRVSDKNPVNFLHLGLILRLLPGARVIHCQRDPLDTCLSCYFHNLAGPHMFNVELSMLANWYRQYERVMHHWRGIIGESMLEVCYEELVASPEAQSRRIIEFLGLPWDERCLRFYETRRATLTPSVDQVRRPMYASSVGRWKNYERHLGPLIQGLHKSAD